MRDFFGTIDRAWEGPRGGDKEEGKINKRVKSFISSRRWPKAWRISQLLVCLCDGAAPWGVILTKIGFPANDVQDILANATSVFQCETDIQQIAATLHNSTRFSTEGLAGVVSTSSGALAGMPLADLIFQLCISKVLLKVRDALREHNLLESIDDTYIYEVSSVDDCLFPVYASADTLLKKLAHTAFIICTTFSQFGLVPNFAKGKT